MDDKKIFISHSTKNAKNKAILEGVCNALSHDGHKVLVDKELQPDNEWFPCLYEYMMECHAAVILLSEDALKSDWVKAEAAVLCARRRSVAGFKLILVPLGDVNAEQLDDHSFFKAIRISDFQTIDKNISDQEIPNRVAGSLHDLIITETPFDELTVLIREVLHQLEEDDEALKRVWESTEEAANVNDDYADALARTLLRDHQNVFSRLRLLVEKLAHILTRRQALNLIEIVKGNWVNPAAASLLRMSREEERLPALAINGVEIVGFTGHSYSRKAWPFPSEYKLISAGAARTLPEIQSTLYKELGKSAVSDKRRERRVKGYKHPLLLVFPYPEDRDREVSFPDEGLIQDIQGRYENITIVLETGAEIPENLDYVLPLEPLLEEGQEDCQCDGYEDITGYVNEFIAD